MQYCLTSEASAANYMEYLRVKMNFHRVYIEAFNERRII